MAVYKTLLYIFIQLTVLHLIATQEGSGDSSPPISEPVDDGPGPAQDRFFFPSITTTSCNFTTQPGLSCASCNQALFCNRNNVGIVKRCHFLKRFCNNGGCSFFPGTACVSTTTAATTTVAASTTTVGVSTDGTATT